MLVGVCWPGEAGAPSSSAFRALIRDLGQHATVVVSTHVVEDVGTACSEVALMAEGKVVFRGTPDELSA